MKLQKKGENGKLAVKKRNKRTFELKKSGKIDYLMTREMPRKGIL